MLNLSNQTAITEYGVKVLRHFALEHIKHRGLSSSPKGKFPFPTHYKDNGLEHSVRLKRSAKTRLARMARMCCNEHDIVTIYG
jgi:hypothetical protein